MPNWTDEEGFNWFNKLECKRCLNCFEANKTGEVPLHLCHGAYYTSHYERLSGTSHFPLFVCKEKPKDHKEPKRV